MTKAQNIANTHGKNRKVTKNKRWSSNSRLREKIKLRIEMESKQQHHKWRVNNMFRQL